MTSEQNSLSFYLNILEVSGKTIVDTYVSDMRKHLNELGLKHTFDIITDEDFFVNKMTGGAKTTFPYAHFENAMNSMRDILPGSTQKSKPVKYVPIPDTNYDDTTITHEPKEEDDKSDKSSTNVLIKNELVTRMLSYNPVDLDDTLSKNSSKRSKSSTQIKTPDVMLTVPDDYTGIMHVLLTINVKNPDAYVSGGITQLNQFLEIYNKKEDD